jgi:hypothetical protein
MSKDLAKSRLLRMRHSIAGGEWRKLGGEQYVFEGSS